jgi:acyl dehydratase
MHLPARPLVMRENWTHDELEPGRSAELTRVCSADDLFIFASATANHNPMHLPDQDGDGDGTPEGVVPGMWVAALISAVLGSLLPGPGTLYRSQTLDFTGRAMVGDTLTAKVTVIAREAGRLVRLSTTVARDDGSPVVTGEALVEAPARKMRFEDHELPALTVQRHVHFDRLIEAVRTAEPVPTAVIAPEEPMALEGALMAAAAGLIAPVLVGDPGRIAKAAETLGADLAGIRIVPAASHAEAARAGVGLVHKGEVRALMKGHLHTDVLLGGSSSATAGCARAAGSAMSS